MKHLPDSKFLTQKAFRRSIIFILLFLIILASCTKKTETITVEVTRVVTETVVVEGESIEVTRVVKETVEAETEIEPETPPAATGSEDDAGPQPPHPDNGPKLAERRGSTPASEIALETAVTVRSSQTSSTLVQTDVATTHSFIGPIERQKRCKLALELHKKRCD